VTSTVDHYKLGMATLNRRLFIPLSDPLEDFTTILALLCMLLGTSMSSDAHIYVVRRSHPHIFSTTGFNKAYLCLVNPEVCLGD